MPLVLAPKTVERTRKLQGSTPWVWLWQIVADETVTSSPTFALTNYPAEITYRGVKYFPYPVQPSEIKLDADTLPTLELRIANVYKQIAQHLHIGDGFIARPVELTIVPLDLLDEPDVTQPHAIRWDFRVASASATAGEITLRCEVPNFYVRNYPEQRITPNRCRFRYGLQGGGCPYILTTAAGYPSCGKLVSDCFDRGADMKARGYPEWVDLPHGGFAGTDVGT